MSVQEKKPKIRFFYLLVLLILIIGIVIISVYFLSPKGQVALLLRKTDEESLNKLIEMGDKAVEPLISGLDNSKRQIRNVAAEALGHIGDPRAVKPLIDSMIYYSNDEAAVALGMIGDKIAVDPVVTHYRVSKLSTDQEVLYLEVIQQLDKHRAFDIAIDIGCEASRSKEREKINYLADKIIRRADQQDSEKIVKKLLSCNHPDTRQMLVDLIIKLDLGAEASNALITVLQSNPDYTLTHTSFNLLAEIKDKSAVEPLIKLLVNKNYRWKTRVAYLLNEFNDSDLTPLLDPLRNSDLETIASAYEFYIIRGEEGTEPQLGEALMVYGDEDMAETYKLCGNYLLEKAANSWLYNKHGEQWIILPPSGIQWGGE